MARHYSVREFFRQTSNNLLERFFHTYALFNEIDFKSMKESKPDELLQAWLDLPEKQRNEMDAILQEIFELGCEKGFIAIVDEAKWQMETEPEKLEFFIATLSDLPNHYDRAIAAFLDYPECWKGATRFYHADTLSYYWRKRKNMGNKPAAFNREYRKYKAPFFHIKPSHPHLTHHLKPRFIRFYPISTSRNAV